MPIVHKVEKCRKSPGTCARCGATINKGEPYYHFEFRYGGRRVFCGNHYPKASERTQSKMSAVYAAQETFAEVAAKWTVDTDRDEVVSALADVAEAVRGVAEEYRESAEAIESGTGNRMPKCDELEEKADELEGWADEIESVDVPEREDYESGEDWLDAVQSETGIVEECPC